jgi:hypothetical protein
MSQSGPSAIQRPDFITPHQRGVKQRSRSVGLREAIPLPHLALLSKEAAA